MPRRRGWRCRAPSPRPISICCWPMQNGDIADATVAERAGDSEDLTQSRFNAGPGKCAARWNRPRRCCRMAKVDQLRFAAQRELDVHAIAALTGQGAAAYAGITRPTPDWMRRCRCPTACRPICLARRPDILAARARVDAAAKGREAAHAEFYPNINLAALVGLPGDRPFQPVQRRCLHHGRRARRSICRSSMPARSAPNMPAPPPSWMLAVADYNGAVVSAVKQTADAMTQVKSLAAQRAQQQDARWTAPTRAFASGRGTLRMRPVRPDSHADRRSHLAAGAPADGGAGRRAPPASASPCCCRWAAASIPIRRPTRSPAQDVTP